MKLRVSVLLSVALTLFVIGTVQFADLYYEDAANYSSRRVSFKVHPGTTFKEVQAQLVEAGVLTRPGVFRWAAYLTRRETKIRAGRYLFRYGESVASVLNKLVYGRVDYARVVIPEGLMMREIASILQKEVEIDSALFMAAASDSAVLADFDIDAPDLEGYLFPDTYLFDWPLSEKEVLERMVNRFHRIYDAAIAGLADSTGMNLHEIVTLASIIQAEAIFNSEMRHISAVYHNRIDAGWRLEADPTVAYALGGVKRPLYYKDLRVPSAYNTYRVRGLPPGAICSPGRTALEAAVLPLDGCEDYYFVADGSGRHRFSKTHSEHLKAKHLIKYGPVPPEVKQKTYTESIDGAKSKILEGIGDNDDGLSKKPAQPASDDPGEERE
ncbi:MAG: endolytic transglycosylase MltG [Candidatus Krumholzibacteriota bacterium]|nr:endolytic transglycosylase MltG [Candidatus Krumholzibacteriota bacterium]